jgi:hypothetical protein
MIKLSGNLMSPLFESQHQPRLYRLVYGKKKKNLARDVAIYLCREMTGETSVALIRRVDICGAGIAARHDRIASLRGGKTESEGKYLIIEMRSPQVPYILLTYLLYVRKL